jgi:hypothetical protein
LPDGIFSDQKSQSGEFLEGLEMENILWALGIGILRPFTQYILWPFGNLHSRNLVYFTRFGILYRQKSGNPAFKSRETNFKVFSFLPLRFFHTLGYT